MSCNITTIANFDRQAKKLAKHYPSFRKDFEAFLKREQKKINLNRLK